MKKTIKEIQHMIKHGKNQKEINKGWMLLAEYEGEL